MSDQQYSGVGSGLTTLVGAIAIAFGAMQPWAQARMTTLNVDIKIVSFEIAPHVDFDKSGGEPWVIGSAGALLVLAILITVTRVGWLGTIWRFFAVFAFAPAACVTGYVWYVVQEGPALLSDQPNASAGQQLVGFALSKAQEAGLWTVAPQEGLYIMTIGGVVAFVGLLIPASKVRSGIQHFTPSNPVAYQHPQTQTPAGWYKTDAGYRYWDGRTWSDVIHPF